MNLMRGPMNFPRSTQTITQAAPINGSPYGNSIMGLIINPQDPKNAIYNYAEANVTAMMQTTGDNGHGYYKQYYYNLYGNSGSMLNGSQNIYSNYPKEPYSFGVQPVGSPFYGMRPGYGYCSPMLHGSQNTSSYTSRVPYSFGVQPARYPLPGINPSYSNPVTYSQSYPQA